MANTARLVIDPIARKISTKYEKIRLVQNDNNSTRVTFEMPRYVRGHDMSKCSTVEVHYDNISIDRRQVISDVYFVSDITVAPEDENTINFSWLVDRNATQVVGTVEFSLHFGCHEDPSLEYAWHTTNYSGIVVLEGKHNTEKAVDYTPSVFESFKESVQKRVDEARAFVAEAQGIVDEARDATLNANDAASQAFDAASGVVTIEQNSGSPLKFWVGTQEEYEALPEEERENVFAIITDDTTKEALFDAIEVLRNEFAEFCEWVANGTIVAKEATHATNADEATHAASADEAASLKIGTPVLLEDNTLPETGYYYICAAQKENYNFGAIRYRSFGVMYYNRERYTETYSLGYEYDNGSIRYLCASISGEGHVSLNRCTEAESFQYCTDDYYVFAAKVGE